MEKGRPGEVLGAVCTGPAARFRQSGGGNTQAARDHQGGCPSSEDRKDRQVEQAPDEAASVEQAAGTVLGRDLVLFLVDLSSNFIPLSLEPPP